MKKFLLILSLIAILSCDRAQQRYEILGFAQGSTYKVIYINDSQSVNQSEIDNLLNEFNKSCSVFDSTSLISRLNRGETDSVDRYISDCEKIAREIYELSEGAYDITSEPLSRAYGFLRAQKTDTVNLDSLLLIVGHDKIRIENGKMIKSDPRVSINLNSIAQGYSVDLVSDYLRNKGLVNYLVEIGGEIYCSGMKSDTSQWKVGVDKPIDGNMTAGSDLQIIIPLKDKGLNTSGNYRKFFMEGGKRVNHIVDPRTGNSTASDMLSATVIANSAVWSDGFATMMMVIGSEKCKEFLTNRKDIQGYIIYHEGDSIRTFSTLDL